MNKVLTTFAKLRGGSVVDGAWIVVYRRRNGVNACVRDWCGVWRGGFTGGELIRQAGRSPTVEVDEVVAVVMVEAVLLEDFECVVPEAVDAEVEDTVAEMAAHVREVIFGCFVHNLFMVFDFCFARHCCFTDRFHAFIFGSSMTGRVGHLRGDPQKR